jgi:NADH-quinone oxidoreductase subunit E
MKAEMIQEILDRHSGKDGGLIPVLEEIQAKYSFLPEEALRMVSKARNISLVDVYGVATFYRAFSLKPRGKHLISVCVGTACHVRGAPAVAREFEAQLGIEVGENTPDGEFTLETVNCLGACALGPIVVIDGHYFSNVNQGAVKGILADAEAGLDAAAMEQDYHVFPVGVSCPRCNHSLMDPGYAVDGYPSIKVTASFGTKHGWLRLSSLYGSYAVFSEHPIPDDTIVDFFCPHCHADLRAAAECSLCGAAMIPMIVRGGGIMQICARRGCRSHMLDLTGVNL